MKTVITHKDISDKDFELTFEGVEGGPFHRVDFHDSLDLNDFNEKGLIFFLSHEDAMLDHKLEDFCAEKIRFFTLHPKGTPVNQRSEITGVQRITQYLFKK